MQIKRDSKIFRENGARILPAPQIRRRITKPRSDCARPTSARGYCCINRQTAGVQTKPGRDAAGIPASTHNGGGSGRRGATQPAPGTSAMLMSPKLRCYLVCGGRERASEGLPAVAGPSDGSRRRRGAERAARQTEWRGGRRPPIGPGPAVIGVIRHRRAAVMRARFFSARRTNAGGERPATAADQLDSADNHTIYDDR